MRELRRLQILPWRGQEGHVVLATVEIGKRQLEWADSRYGADGFEFVITSPFDIFWDLQRSLPRCRQSARPRSALSLETGTFGQGDDHEESEAATIVTGAIAYLVFLVIAPRAALIATMAVITSSLHGHLPPQVPAHLGRFKPQGRHEHLDRGRAALRDDELPVFTVLVPMYREAQVLPLLSRCAEELDYPLGKLDIKIVLEADDTETIEVAKACGRKACSRSSGCRPRSRRPSRRPATSRCASRAANTS